MQEDEARRRVKAARAYAGLSVPDLAKKAEIGERTLRSLEGPAGRPFRTMELNAIAEACGVPREWFSIPFAWLQVAELIQLDLSAVEVSEHTREVRRQLRAAGLDGANYRTYEEGQEVSRQMDLTGAIMVVNSTATEDGELAITAIRVRPRREPVTVEVGEPEKIPPVVAARIDRVWEIIARVDDLFPHDPGVVHKHRLMADPRRNLDRRGDEGDESDEGDVPSPRA